jgi:hypothetical protein
MEIDRFAYLRKDKIGQRYITNEGYTIEIVEQIRNGIYSVIFDDGTLLRNKKIGNIVTGKIKNPNHKSVYGVGFLGIGKYKISENGNLTKYCNLWIRMIQRCYDIKYLENQPTYKNCSVSEEWHNFQNFSEWVENNYTEEFALDKDILQKENKMYSKETCCFVPAEINNLFTKRKARRGDCPIGVLKNGNKFKASFSKNKVTTFIGSYNSIEEAFYAYKKEKEKHIKEVAEKWKDKISKKVYQALINYEVNIND